MQLRAFVVAYAANRSEPRLKTAQANRPTLDSTVGAAPMPRPLHRHKDKIDERVINVKAGERVINMAPLPCPPASAETQDRWEKC